MPGLLMEVNVENSKRERIFKRFDEGASPETVHREFADRLESCGWSYILALRRFYDRTQMRESEAVPCQKKK